MNAAFAVLDRDGSGVVDLADVAAIYDVSKHPEFISGKKTKDKILRELLDNFDVGGVKDGMVTKQEFRNYYSAVSAGIDKDDYFELMIRNAWHISGGVGAAENSANRRVLVTRSDGSQFVQEVKNDLGLQGKDRQGVMTRLRQQGVQAASIDFEGKFEPETNDRFRNKSMPMTQPRRPVSASVASSRNSTSSFSNNFPSPSGGDQTQNPELADGEDADVDDSHPLVKRLKERLLARGSNGIIGLQRTFKIMDDDGSKSLNMMEFKKAMRECAVNLTENEIVVLFRIFGECC